MAVLLFYWLALLSITLGLKERKFPDEFIFGASTSSFQVEGGWKAGGKGESMWDHLTHENPNMIEDGSNADIAADSYHKYKRDVEMMRELGLDAYRFSLSWPRILPTGLNNEVNEEGVAYYNKLIDEMLKYKIQPIVTMYHWDLPQRLQELGGWTNPLIVDWFEDYAKVVFYKFGDRVKTWITINEPREICHEGYGWYTKAPALDSRGVAEYFCSRHLLLAHATVYHTYYNMFKSKQGGRVGITINTNWYEAASDKKLDLQAAELMRQGQWEQYAHPIFSEFGDWPPEFQKRVDGKSSIQGFPRSRLPPFSSSEVKFVKGASDFFGMNHYTAVYVYHNESATSHGPVPSLYDDLEGSIYTPNEWPRAASSWLRLSPDSLYYALKYVSERYNYPEILVTENGWSTKGGLEDVDRVRYLRAAWSSLLDALDDGVAVKGYMIWSLMDNFEWLEGFSSRFGLYEVDFEDPERERIPRMSALVYKELVRTRVINESYTPETLYLVID